VGTEIKVCENYGECEIVWAWRNSADWTDWTDGKETKKGQPAGCMSHGRVNGKVNGLPTLIMSVWGYVPIDNRFRTRF